MFEAIYNLKKLGNFNSFKEAFKAIYDAILTADPDDSFSYQTLETAVWVKDDNSPFPVMFYDARDRACDEGWIVDGKWINT